MPGIPISRQSALTQIQDGLIEELGLFYLQQAEYSKAVAAFNNRSDLRQRITSNTATLGRAYMFLGNNAKAIAALEQSLQAATHGRSIRKSGHGLLSVAALCPGSLQLSPSDQVRR